MHRIAALLGLLLLCACATTPPKSADGVFSLRPGEMVTLRIDATGVTETARGPAPPASSSLAALANDLTSGALGPAMGADSVPIPNASGETAAPAPPNALRLRLLAIPGDQTMLLIENGYADKMKYRAAIVRGASPSPTDVCEVLPQRHGVEHWPYIIDRIDVSAITLLPWQANSAPVCE